LSNYYSRPFSLSLFILTLFISGISNSQAPLFSGTAVSDSGVNNIGQANTSKNVAVGPNGNIYVVYSGTDGIRVARSLDRGQSFEPSVLVNPTTGSEPGIMVNDQGIVFVSFVSNNLFLSKSVDDGISFSAARSVAANIFGAAHMASFENNIYLTNTNGSILVSNASNGDGAFVETALPRSYVFADVFTDLNGRVFVSTDDPDLFLFSSVDQGQTVNEIDLDPDGSVFFSSYALSDGPCGTYIFTSGQGTVGYRLDVNTGMTSIIQFSNNTSNVQGRTLFADNTGVLIDGYRADNGELQMKVSGNQGATFGPSIVIAAGDSHNIARNPFTDDIVVVYSQNNSIFLSVYPDILKSIELNELAVQPDFCASNSFEVAFELTGNFATDTFFEAVLSDSNGDFQNSSVIGSVTTGSSGIIECTIPNDLPFSSNYRVILRSDEACLQSNPINLTIDNSVEITGDTELCEGEISQLSGSGVPATNSPWTSSDPTIATVDDTGQVTTLMAGTTTINFTNAQGCSGSIDITVTEPISITGNQPVCINEQLMLGFTGGSSDLNWNVSDTSIATIDENGLVTTLAVGTTTITGTDDNGCSSQIEFVVNPLPEFILPVQLKACADDDGNVVIDTPILDSTLDPTTHIFEWYLDDQLLEMETEPSIAVNFTGVYRLIAINNSTGCSFTQQTEVLPKDRPVLDIQITSNDFAENQTIIATATGDGDFEYSIGDDIWLGNGVFTNLDDGEYTVTVRDKNGCGEASQIVFILSYPKFFTPNNDGFNDVWRIAGLRPDQDAAIYIFDRFGKLLKQLNPSSAGWDGTYNGVEMPSSDYWFRISYIPNGSETQRDFRANFSLKR
jgi:gliding motility-associated-like protein